MHWSSIVLLAFAVGEVSAHGYVQQIRVHSTGQYIEAWNPYKDPSKNVNKITRKFKDNGPVTDGLFEVCAHQMLLYGGQVLTDMVQTDAITCNIAKDGNHNVPVNATAPIPAGSLITFYWTDWQSDHPGPSNIPSLNWLLVPMTDNIDSHDVVGKVPRKVRQLQRQHWKRLGKDPPSWIRRQPQPAMGVETSSHAEQHMASPASIQHRAWRIYSEVGSR